MTLNPRSFMRNFIVQTPNNRVYILYKPALSHVKTGTENAKGLVSQKKEKEIRLSASIELRGKDL